MGVLATDGSVFTKIRVGGLTGPTWTTSGATPEGAITAPVGSLHSRTDTGALYTKTTGAGPTGWAQTASSLLASAVGWWDIKNYSGTGQTLANLGTGGSALDATFGSTASLDTNDPQFLAPTQSPYIYLPGSTGNYLSVPNAANLQITGDIELVWQGSYANPAQLYALVGKWTAPSPGYNYLLGLVSAVPTLYWSASGSNTGNPSAAATASVPYGGNVPFWLKATLRVNNGASGNTVTFWTAPDQLTEPTSWTQLGATITAAGVTSIAVGNSNVYVGSQDNAWSHEGVNYRVIVRSGIGGTTVLDINTSAITTGSAASFTATTGQTVTINRSATGRKAAVVMNNPKFLLGTDDYFEVPDNTLLNFGATQNFTALVFARRFGTVANLPYITKKADFAATAGWSIDSGTGGTAPRTVIADGTLSSSSTGATIANGAAALIVAVRNVTADTITTLSPSTGTPVTDTTTTTLSNTGALRIGALSGGTFTDMCFMAAAVFPRALSVAEIATMSAYYTARYP